MPTSKSLNRKGKKEIKSKVYSKSTQHVVRHKSRLYQSKGLQQIHSILTCQDEMLSFVRLVAKQIRTNWTSGVCALSSCELSRVRGSVVRQLVARLETDERVHWCGQLWHGDATSLFDELGHGLVLCRSDADELASVVNHSTQPTLWLQRLYTVDCILARHTGTT